MIESAGLVWVLVSPILTELGKAALDDYVKDFFKGCIKDVEGLANKPFAQNAVRDALKSFIILFEQELGRSYLDKKQSQQYLQPLKQFIKTETLELVRDRAQNDRDPILRDFAQQKLAELEGQ